MAQGIFNLKQVNQAIRQGAWSAFNPPQWVEYLVVAGGGAGGTSCGGGGGAGGLLTGILPVATGTSITATVGAGGASGSTNNGGNSLFGNITASGGGLGGNYNSSNGSAGGSGGGAANGNSGHYAGQGIFGQGNNGGAGGNNIAPYGGSGGGGAGTVGITTVGSPAGNGGAGIASSISGTVTTYAGGGGGGVDNVLSATGWQGVGGVGGGGTGGFNTTLPTAGSANTGGGGGGCFWGGGSTQGGSGGSGSVVVRYPGTIAFYTGGSVYTINGYVVHRFTSTGTLTPTTPAAATAAPTTIGQAFQGGYYAGMVAANGSGFPTHYLVVAPKASGQQSGAWSSVGTNTGFTSVIDGPTNSAGIAALGASYAAATFCEGLSIGGYTDWYMPAQNELEVCYYFMKSVSQNNHAPGTHGSNANAVAPEPISTKYTATNPPQTPITAFQVGNTEAFNDGTYWSSTDYTDNGQAYYQSFYSGDPGVQSVYAKTTGFVVRAVRRVAI